LRGRTNFIKSNFNLPRRFSSAGKTLLDFADLFEVEENDVVVIGGGPGKK
jgi:hypothetical protein